MNLIDLLNRELFRPFVTLLIPGVTALLPLALVAEVYNPGIFAFGQANPTLGLILGGMAAVASGLVLENIGSRFEVHVLDRIHDKKNKEFLREWDEYLGTRERADLVASSYLKSIQLRMQFEIGFGLALIVASGGLIWLNSLRCMWKPEVTALLVVCILVIAAYLLRESYTSAAVRGKVRKILIGKEAQATIEGATTGTDGERKR